MATIEQISGTYLDEARQQVRSFEIYVKENVTRQLKARWISWHEIAPAAARAGYAAPQDLIAANEIMDQRTREFAQLLDGLDKQKFLMVLTEIPGREGGTPEISIIHAKAAKEAGILGAWITLPILWTGLQVAAGIGAFIVVAHYTLALINAWQEPQKLEQEAKLLHEKNIAELSKILDRQDVPPDVKTQGLALLNKTADKLNKTTNAGFLSNVLGATATGTGGLAAGLIVALLLMKKSK
jgi:hypothetical protein